MATANDKIVLPQGTTLAIQELNPTTGATVGSPITITDCQDITPGDHQFAEVVIRSLSRTLKNKLPGIGELGNLAFNALFGKVEYLALRTLHVAKKYIQCSIVLPPDLTADVSTKLTVVFTGYSLKMPSLPPIKDDENAVPYSFEMACNGVTVT